MDYKDEGLDTIATSLDACSLSFMRTATKRSLFGIAHFLISAAKYQKQFLSYLQLYLLYG